MTGRIESVTFDIDDTLYLESAYAASGFRAVGQWVEAQWKLPGFAERAQRLFNAGARGTVFNQALQALGTSDAPDRVAQLVAVYRRHVPEIELLPDARRTLELLHGRLPLACISDGPLESQSAKAEALGLKKWISPILLTESFGPGFGKPHPRAFELVEQAHEVPGHACIYVADNPAKDFKGAKARGWTTLRIRRAGGQHAQVAHGADVDATFESLEDINWAVWFR